VEAAGRHLPVIQKTATTIPPVVARQPRSTRVQTLVDTQQNLVLEEDDDDDSAVVGPAVVVSTGTVSAAIMMVDVTGQTSLAIGTIRSYCGCCTRT
jgi:hypothetical protein